MANEEVIIEVSGDKYYTDEARSWAISENLVAGIDYSAKHYAMYTKERTDIINDNLTAINTVSTNISDVGIVSTNISDVNATAGSITQVAAVGADLLLDDDSEIVKVNANKTNINTVATNISNVNTVSDSISNVNTVGDNIAKVNVVAVDMSKVYDVAVNIYDVKTVADNILKVDAVADNETNINTVATDLLLGDSSNVKAVAANITNVNAVAGNETNINAVVDNETNINAVNSNKTNINAVATNIANVNAVNANKTNIDAVAGNATNINAVNSNKTNIDAVAGNATNINAVNANKTNIDTVAGSISNINTVATNISNINAVKNDLTNINAVKDDLTNIDTVTANITDINTVAENIEDIAEKQNVITYKDMILLPNTLSSMNILGDNNNGRLYTEPKTLAKVKSYAHSTFDSTKFTVVGSPNITDDGIASGFSSSNKISKTLSLTGTKLVAKAGFYYKVQSASNAVISFLQSGTSAGYCYISATGSIGLYTPATTAEYLFISTSEMTLAENDFIIATVEFNENSTSKITVINTTTGETLTKTGTAIWNKNIEDITSSYFGSSGSNIPYEGKIDLKYYSISVDGVEAFSGNKTGIDTIKPDDYTIVGTPTISADGVASGFSARNYLRAVADTISSTNATITIKATFTISTKSTEANKGLFKLKLNNTEATGIFLFKNASGALQIRQDSAYKLSTSTANYDVNIPFDVVITITNKALKLSLIQNDVTIYNELAGTLNADLSINQIVLCDGGDTNTIDLNSFKIYVDGNLVYQPCLKIPYTESKTGSKVVDSYYRNRVSDMAEQFGYAPYYTLNENKANNYIVVGNPTISADGIVTNYDRSNVVRGYNILNLLNKSWKIKTVFRYDNPTIANPLFTFTDYISSGGVGINNDKSLSFNGKFGEINTEIPNVIRFAYSETNFVVGNLYEVALEFDILTGKYTLSYKGLNDNLSGSKSYTPTSTDKQIRAIYLQTDYLLNICGGTIGWVGNACSIDLNSFKIYVNGKLAYKAIQPPCFTLPYGSVDSAVAPKMLVDSATGWEQYLDRTMIQRGTMTADTPVTFPCQDAFADTDYSLSCPYSAKTTTGFTPTASGEYIAIGKF